MKVIGKDRTSCDVCNPIDEILARLDALERRASAIVAKVQGLAPDGEGNVTLPTSSSDTDPLHGRIDAFAMSSEVKEAVDDAHAYAASIADDVVVINSEIEAIKASVQTLQTADTKNVKLDTNQVITGHKKFVQTSTAGVPLEAERKGNGAGVSVKQTDQKMTDAGVQYYSGMYIYDGNGNRVGGWYPVKEDNNRTTLRMRHNNAAGETRELVVDGDFVLSSSMVSKKYVESTDGVTNNLVHRTGNEHITSGNKSFENPYGIPMITFKGINANVNAGSYQASIPRLEAVDKNGVSLWQLETAIQTDGRVALNCRIRNSDGTIKSITLAQGDVIQ